MDANEGRNMIWMASRVHQGSWVCSLRALPFPIWARVRRESLALNFDRSLFILSRCLSFPSLPSKPSLPWLSKPAFLSCRPYGQVSFCEAAALPSGTLPSIEPGQGSELQPFCAFHRPSSLSEKNR